MVSRLSRFPDNHDPGRRNESIHHIPHARPSSGAMHGSTPIALLRATRHSLPGRCLRAQMPTASSSAQFPGISVTLPTPGLTPSPGVELLSLTSAGPQAVVIDLKGNVIWYCPGNAEPVKPLQNGHFIIVRPLDLQEVDLACNVIRDVSYTQVNQSLQANRL